LRMSEKVISSPSADGRSNLKFSSDNYFRLLHPDKPYCRPKNRDSQWQYKRF